MTRRHVALLVLLGALAACEGPQNFMDAAGPGARGLAALGWFVLLLFSVVTLVVWGLIAWLAVRRRGTLAEHAPAHTGGGQSWIMIGGVAVPVAILAIVFISSMQTISAYPLVPHHGGAADLRLTGEQWWFTAEYPVPGRPGTVSSPTEIHVPVGEPVNIELVSRDVIHSFWVPKLHGKVDLVPGQTNMIQIQVDEPGVYEGECAEFCGVQHAHMRVLVIGHAQDEYRQWFAAQLADATPPASAQTRRGQQVFMGAACPLCHAIRGTGAHGNVGPDLTHVGSRLRIAGGILENNTANLSAWVMRAQSLKPGSKMPDIGGFSGDDLQALVAYLQSLR